MQLPGIPSLILLAFILGLFPLAALRSAQRLRARRDASAPQPGLSRTRIWTGTLAMQGVLLVLAVQVGHGFGYEIFAVPPLGLGDILLFVGALAACFVLRIIARRMYSEDERRKLAVYTLAPRTRREALLQASTILLASVAEEAAYRGVGLSILWYTFGSFWVAAAISAVAFALAHSTQGWKSGLVIFVFAVVLQALVSLTGTLVLAMIVHATYDFVAAFLISRDARRFDAESAFSTCTQS